MSWLVIATGAPDSVQAVQPDLSLRLDLNGR